ncbi:MAG: DUF131 domain-containing protein, partial [Halobacteria archaeon]|nr:DUF131 domain-containing protein [Halobacteria archaeon]
DDAGGENSNTNVEGGGIIFIGPIPIVFGSSKGVVWIALAIAFLMLLFFVATRT